MRKKQMYRSMLALVIIFPVFLNNGFAHDHAYAEASKGQLTSKDEVIYATLEAGGTLEDIYVVNTLDVAEAGEIQDFGMYDSVKNLTDLSEIQQENESISIQAPEGKFYYQGNMQEDTDLPWNIEVTYSLDGNETNAADLAGQSGQLEISINVSANENVDSVFYENYLLQVSLQLSNLYENIEASGGMIANAGENKQVTFTVMPGQEDTLSVQADVNDFEFQGIDIAAAPSTLPIDTSEINNLTDDMGALTDAISELNNGVADLRSGVSQLNDGASSMGSGSSEYLNGIHQLDGSSYEIINASKEIGGALSKMNSALSGSSSNMDPSSLTELPKGLLELAAGLTQAASGLNTLSDQYAKSYQALDAAIAEIPAGQLTEQEIAGLYASGADAKVLDKLIATYKAAQKVKATYSAVKAAFAAVKPSLDELNGNMKKMSGTLSSISENLTGSLQGMDMSGLSELQKGLAALSANYSEFHSGLVGYTGGVNQLASSYSQLHTGITGIANGTSELNEGTAALQDGTAQLYEETKDMPAEMQAQINEMIGEFDKSDFTPVSFTSSKNEDVHSVQFVIKTSSIEKKEEETKTAEPKEEKGFWDLLLDLFR
ncbi:YhgE/Pip domain-containing protein [Bacillus mesophilum]|nr:YhgE/Pip domain-containing protein [Bacillus mesophilum]